MALWEHGLFVATDTVRTMFRAFSFFTFYQPCFGKSQGNWIRWMFLWNLILIVTIKRFSYLLLIQKIFSKKDQSLRNTNRNKAGKIKRWNIFYRIYSDLCNSTFNLITPIIKPNFIINWFKTSKSVFRTLLKIYGGAFFYKNS